MNVWGEMCGGKCVGECVGGNVWGEMCGGKCVGGNRRKGITEAGQKHLEDRKSQQAGFSNFIQIITAYRRRSLHKARFCPK